MNKMMPFGLTMQEPDFFMDLDPALLEAETGVLCSADTMHARVFTVHAVHARVQNTSCPLFLLCIKLCINHCHN